MSTPDRKWRKYKDGELELILSLVPSQDNIKNLASVLDRSEDAIEIVYKIAYGVRNLGKGIQREKIAHAKEKLGIEFGGKP